ncbi:MAG: redoxin domain-containing protein [Gemmatimonadetes bacterium]|nr:redoxin domain-containing protein [Gemmatimonadota bacterium]
MNWRRAILGALVAVPLLALFLFGLGRVPRAIPSPLPGRPAPLFALESLDRGDTVRLAGLRGQVVVLNFWASWCLACRDEHAALSAVAENYRDRGVRFFGLLYNDSPENGRRWIEEMGGQSYPSLIDPGSRTAIDYGLYGVPETFFITADGAVGHKQIGPVTVPLLERTLDALLASPPETAR